MSTNRQTTYAFQMEYKKKTNSLQDKAILYNKIYKNKRKFKIILFYCCFEKFHDLTEADLSLPGETNKLSSTQLINR